MSGTSANFSVQDSPVVSALTEFSTNLFKAASAENGFDDNLFISPFSIAAVLAMVLVGTKGNTAAQVKDSLNLTSFSDQAINNAMGNLIRAIKGDENFILESVNQLYVADKYELLDTFQSALTNHFGAPAQSVDFTIDATRININTWVQKLTHDKIKNLLPNGSIDLFTILVLVNAVYFKGNWMQKFDSSLTKLEPFFLNSEDAKIDAQMMHIDGEFRTGSIESLDARLIELPYVGNRLSMFIVLPNKTDGLAQLESNISRTFINEVDSMLMRKAKLHVAIPKFKIEASVPVKDLLIKLGMIDVFGASSADLSGISGKRELYVSKIFHKTFIEVNEEGSTAAAATAGIVSKFRAATQPTKLQPFVVDHPALFFIRDNHTRMVLFIGRLAKPEF